MNHELVFDEALHKYTRDGKVVASVTQILKVASCNDFIFVDPDILETASINGTLTHDMIHAEIMGELDIDAVKQHEYLAPYYASWMQFRKESDFSIYLSEARVYSSKHNFAGTLDLGGEFGLKANKPGKAIIDTKRVAQVRKITGPQLAAYKQGAIETFPAIFKESDDIMRYALHLKKSGGWQLIPFIDKADMKVFLSCQNIQQFLNK